MKDKVKVTKDIQSQLNEYDEDCIIHNCVCYYCRSDREETHNWEMIIYEDWLEKNSRQRKIEWLVDEYNTIGNTAIII